MSSSKPPILIVDDEPELLYSLAGLLRREFELHTAPSGQHALEILAAHPIQVIMSDQRMPGMTGSELMQRVKDDFPNAVRIIFTGYADIKAVIDAINRGGLYRYLTKPWDPDELVEVLREATARYAAGTAQQRLRRDISAYVDDAVQVAESAANLTTAHPAATTPIAGLPDLLERGRHLQRELKRHDPFCGTGADGRPPKNQPS